ncbi:peroxynitrite isomerase THAP4-like [Sycon ciliatum]|uniref:peroxynitrite isomerase THAP4-like n=1 Tax=Sycon ciliatum TaxID=27933 RepID=UPI0031F6EA47
MVKSCCAVGCANRFAKGGGKSFYKFPTNQLRRAKWIAALKRKNWQPNASSWVCSDHFVRFKKSDDPLSPDFVPPVFSDEGRVNGEKAYVKFDRHKARRHAASKPTAQPENTCHGNHEPVLTGESDCNADKEIEEESAPRDSCSSDSVEPASPAQPELTEASSHVDNSAEQENDDLRRRLALLQATVAQLEEDKCQLNGQLQEQKSAISALTVKVQHLEATVKHQKSEAAMSSIISGFKSNDDMVRYETGLPSFAVLEKVFAFAGKDIPDHHRAALPSFAQFIIVLMKLRLNLHDQDLAHRFGISQSTVSKYFHKWIHVLYGRLQPLIIWPERSELYARCHWSFADSLGSAFALLIVLKCFAKGHMI